MSQSRVDASTIVADLWQMRKQLAVAFAVSAALSVAVSLILPKYFRSTTILLPEIQKDKLMGLGGLTDLASLAGVNVGDMVLEKLYPTIVKSEAILTPVLSRKYRTEEFKDSVDLLSYYKLDDEDPVMRLEKGLKIFRAEFDVSIDRQTNVLTVTFASHEPQLSADVLKAVTFELDSFIRTRRRSHATDQRGWIEGRLAEVKRDLQQSEETLKEFREQNRRVADSPELTLQQSRHIRNVEINNTLFVELKKQYEIIRIEEIKNIPIINVLDAPRPAAKKERPQRTLIVLLCTVFGTAGVASFRLGRKYFGQDIRVWLGRFRAV